jgi:hypothetical protein
MWARVANLVLGIWLGVSALLFRHTRYQALNQAICCLLIVAFATAGLVSRWPARLLNLALGGWLILSAFVLPHASVVSAWNQGIVGYLLIGFASMPRSAVEPSVPVNW